LTQPRFNAHNLTQPRFNAHNKFCVI